MTMAKKRGYSGRGRRAVSAQMPKIAIVRTVRTDAGMLRSCDLARVLEVC